MLHAVQAGDDLQAVLDRANPGDVITLPPGAVFSGSFSLPPKPEGALITLGTSAPLPDRRITPADSGLLPVLRSTSVDPTLRGIGAANWLISGIRFAVGADGQYNVIHLHDARNIFMDRLLIAPETFTPRRGIAGNGQGIVLQRSHLSNIWRAGEDSQAFCAWDGAGPYTLFDNYLEAASENVMFGGANSGAPDRVPADIHVEGNQFSKPVAWRGQPRAVKNLFELKAAKRVVVRGNLFEHNWTDAQSGFGILFTVRNDEGGSPWSVVEDVLFEQNILRDTEHGINVLGYDGYQPSGRCTRIIIRDNEIHTPGVFLQAGGEVGDLQVVENRVENGGYALKLYAGDIWPATSAARPAQFAIETLRYRSNHVANPVIFGDGLGEGPAALGLVVQYDDSEAPMGDAIEFEGALWTFGPNHETLRDQLHVDNGYGLEYRVVAGALFVLGTDQQWYTWTGSRWVLHGSEPPEAPSDPVVELTRRVEALEAIVTRLVVGDPRLTALLDYLRATPQTGSTRVLASYLRNTPR